MVCLGNMCMDTLHKGDNDDDDNNNNDNLYPRTGHEGSDGEQVYSFTLPSTLALDGVGSQRHAPAGLPSGKTRYPLYRRLGEP
jgi:hypothetical protein